MRCDIIFIARRRYRRWQRSISRRLRHWETLSFESISTGTIQDFQKKASQTASATAGEGGKMHRNYNNNVRIRLYVGVAGRVLAKVHVRLRAGQPWEWKRPHKPVAEANVAQLSSHPTHQRPQTQNQNCSSLLRHNQTLFVPARKMNITKSFCMTNILI